MYKIKSETARLAVCCLVTALITASACTKYYNYKSRELRYGISTELSTECRKHVANYIEHGKRCMRDGNYFSAYSDFTSALNLDKGNRLISNLKWEAYLMLYKPGGAYYNLFLAEHNKNAAFELFRKSDHLAEDIKNAYPEDAFLEKAKTKEGLKDVAYLVDGLKKMSGMQHLPAEKLFSKAIELDPSSAVAYVARACVRGATGQVDKAEQDFSAAEKIAEGRTDIAIGKAVMYLQNGRPFSALKATDQALEKEPEKFELWLLRSTCLLNGERYEEAEKNLAQLEKYYPNWWQAKMLKGVCAEKRGDMARARALYDEADTFDPAAVDPGVSRMAEWHDFALRKARRLKTKLVLDKPYEIQLLLREVLDERFKGDGTGIRHIAWSKEPLPNAYGITNCENGTIQISCKLNSSQIPKEHVKKVIYHECLHAKGYVDHNKAFYDLESMYPNCSKIKQQMYLDTFFRFEE